MPSPVLDLQPDQPVAEAEGPTLPGPSREEAGTAAGPLPPAEGLPRGTCIGRYVITGELGAGGMGVVYAAYDPDLCRRVAIKLLRASSPDAHARFLREAQSMARLSHENVIAVYDVGLWPPPAADSGEVRSWAFLAMELVEGGTLTQWLGRKPRGWREVLDIFIRAGRGLAAAHAAGLIHRDFKPDNVLVGSDGRVRVLDFGLARTATFEDPAEGSAGAATVPGGAALLDSPLTQAGAIMGTPAYMPLEQFDGRPIDARADQFSFCVALYTALYGEAPYPGKEPRELATSIALGKLRVPPQVSPVPGWLRRALLRGLSRDAQDRHPSMDALLANISRDRRRTVRRALLGGGFLLSIALFLLLPAWIQHRAEQRCRGGARRLAGIWDAKRRAAIEAALLRTGKPYARDAWLRIVPVLDSYARGWVAMHTEACLATQVRGEQSPQLLDLRMECLNQRLDDLASLTALLSRADAAAPEAQAVIENGVQAARELPPLSRCADRQALTATLPPPEGPARTQIAALYRQVSTVRAAEKGERLAAVREEAQALADSARRTGYPPLHAEALYLLGDIQQQLGDMKAAASSLHEAAAAALAGRHHGLAAEAFTLLGLVLGYNERQPEQGLRYAQLARAELDAIGGHEEVQARLLTALGNIHARQGQYDQAVRSFQESAALSRTLHGPDSLDEADSLNDEGAALQAQQRYDEAVARYREALRILQQVLGPRHPSVATNLRNIGIALRHQGHLEEAADQVGRALQIWRQALGADHPRTVIGLLTLGGIRRDQGRLGEARDLYERAVAILQRQGDAEPEALSRARSGLAEVQQQLLQHGH